MAKEILRFAQNDNIYVAVTFGTTEHCEAALFHDIHKVMS